MISIIIPTYNRGALITETINSILNQSYQDFEVLIIDDHSTDNTKEIIKNLTFQDKRIKYAKRPDNMPKGGNSCRNFGFDISQGEYIKWLDSDDLLDKNCLQFQLDNMIRSATDVDICKAEVFSKSKLGTPLSLNGNWGNIESDSSISNYLTYQFKWHTGAGLWKKDYFKKLPLWEIGLSNSQEWLMHLKQLGDKIHISKTLKSLCFVRSHHGSMSDKSKKSGNYYFNECKARKLAFDYLNSNNIEVSRNAKSKITKQFFWFHLFTLYKGGWLSFLKIFKFYISIYKYYFRIN